MSPADLFALFTAGVLLALAVATLEGAHRSRHRRQPAPQVPDSPFARIVSDLSVISLHELHRQEMEIWDRIAPRIRDEQREAERLQLAPRPLTIDEESAGT